MEMNRHLSSPAIVVHTLDLEVEQLLLFDNTHGFPQFIEALDDKGNLLGGDRSFGQPIDSYPNLGQPWRFLGDTFLDFG